MPAVSLKGNMNLSLSSKKQASGNCRPVSILSGTPSKSTPKKVLSHLNTPTSVQKTHGDRFIPSRVGTNLDYSAHKLTFPSRTGTLSSSPSESEKRKVVFDKLLSLEGCTSETRVLRFRSAETENTPTKYQYWSSYGTPKDLSAKKQGRRIPKSADKVLDAPDLQNDFYLNILDWSVKNQIAIALSSCVYLLDIDSGEITSFCDFESVLVTSLQWDPSGKTLAIGTSNAQVQIWDVTAVKLLKTLQTHESRVSSLSWEPHGTLLSSGSQSGSIHHYDIRDPQPVATHEVNAHSLEVCGLRWSPTGRLLASGGNDNTVNVWDPFSTATGWRAPSHTFSQHTAAVKALAWCPWQHNILATGGGTADQYIRAWNVFTGNVESSIDTGSQVSGLLWSPVYHELLSTHGQPDNMVAIWSYPALGKVGRMLGHEDRILHSAMGPDGQTVATASADETLRFWKCFVGDSRSKSKKECEEDASHIDYSLQRYIR